MLALVEASRRGTVKGAVSPVNGILLTVMEEPWSWCNPPVVCWKVAVRWQVVLTRAKGVSLHMCVAVRLAPQRMTYTLFGFLTGYTGILSLGVLCFRRDSVCHIFTQHNWKSCLKKYSLCKLKAVCVSLKSQFFFPMAWQPLGGLGRLIFRGFTITHFLDTPHSVGLLWTSDQPVAQTSTWQHTTLRTDRHPCPRRYSNPQSQ
jgi:hypothetical protein